MSLRTGVLLSFAVLSPGCIPVTEPVGDIDKAEPDKTLVGEWRGKGGDFWVVDCPEVKGNPKGLMRATFVAKGKKFEEAKKDDICWFFFATVGKRVYANVLLEVGKNHLEFAQLNQEGEYVKWTKNEKRGFGIMLVNRDGDTIRVDGTDEKKVEALMKANQFAESHSVYKIPAGWLTKYLEKNGPDGLFKEFDTFTRVKK